MFLMSEKLAVLLSTSFNSSGTGFNIFLYGFLCYILFVKPFGFDLTSKSGFQLIILVVIGNALICKNVLLVISGILSLISSKFSFNFVLFIFYKFYSTALITVFVSFYSAYFGVRLG